MHALILHNMGDPASWREAIADFELAFPRYSADVRCIVHDAEFPVPGYIKRFPFDLIVINSTVLGAVTDPRTLARVCERFSFLESSRSLKVALPQDDYYCSEELDRLMVQWGIDIVHTVCPQHWEVLYPNFLARGGELKLGYTGYVTPRMRDAAALAKPRAARSYDVVYRAAGRPGFPNEMAHTKARLGQRFVDLFSECGWALDITTDDSRTITGRAWWKFLADSRTTLGSNSGSSLLIRNHDVAQSIRTFMQENPRAPYSAVIESCVPAADRALSFTAISPRILEAALVKTTQLLVPGPYSGFLKAGEHYWPLLEDGSNRDEVVRMLNDMDLQDAIAARCKEVVMSTPDIQIEGFLNDLASRVRQHHAAPFAREAEFWRARARHLIDGELKTRRHYIRERTDASVARLKARLRDAAPAWLVRAYRKARGADI